MNVESLQQELRAFAQVRDWTRYHNPKNLAAALIVEAGELLEQFQWLSEEESSRIATDPEAFAAVRDELADVQIYLLRLADVLGVDLEAAVIDKMARNAVKYPVDLVKGRAVKYNRLQRAAPADSDADAEPRLS